MQTLASWLAPGLDGAVAVIVAALVAIGLGAAVVMAIRQMRSSDSNAEKDDPTLLRAVGLLLACYLLVLVCSRLFVGGAIRFDARLFSPAILIAEVGVIVALSSVVVTTRRRERLVAGALIAGWMLAALSVDAPVIEDAVIDGNDFASSEWRDSPAMDWVRTEASGRTLYTNWPAAIYFGSGRTSHDIPNTVNPDTLLLFGKIFSAQRGTFVAFNSRNPDYPPADYIARSIGLVEARKFSDATVWVARSSK